MAIDSAEKRRSLSGIQTLAIVGVTPNSGKDAEWRQEAGWGYPGISASGAGFSVYWAIGSNNLIDGVYDV